MAQAMQLVTMEFDNFDWPELPRFLANIIASPQVKLPMFLALLFGINKMLTALFALVWNLVQVLGIVLNVLAWFNVRPSPAAAPSPSPEVPVPQPEQALHHPPATAPCPEPEWLPHQPHAPHVPVIGIPGPAAQRPLSKCYLTKGTSNKAHLYLTCGSLNNSAVETRDMCKKCLDKLAKAQPQWPGVQ